MGFAAELLLISSGRPNLYATDRPTVLFGILFLAWFWLSVGWLLQLVGSQWHCRFKAWGLLAKCVSWTSLGLAAAILVTAYVISWGLFFRSGRFANLETGRFLLFNFQHLWSYLVEAEPLHLSMAIGVLVAALLGLPGLLYLSVLRGNSRSRPTGWLPPIAWILLALMTVTSWNQIPAQQSALRQAARLHALKNGLHPTFSLYVSHVESRQADAIKPTLDTALLTPLSAADDFPKSLGSAETPPSIILIAVESLRYDVINQRHQGRVILPNINDLARRGLQLTRAYAQSTHSDYADVCLVSSLYPLRTRRHHYYGPSDPWPVTRLYDILKPLGYSTAIISSQNEAWGGMDHFLASNQLDLFYHPETSQAPTWVANRDRGFSTELAAGGLVAGKFADAHTTDKAIEWIEHQAKAGTPFFLSMNLQSSHFPYLMPDEVPRPFAPHDLAPDISFVDYPVQQVVNIRNAYYNAIHECDHQIGRLVTTLHSLKRLQNTIIVVTGENGEAFHECNSVTHASDPVEPVIHIACVIHAPNRISPAVDDYPFEHVDLAPTVLGLVGLPSHPNFQGIDVLSARRPPADTRLTFCHVLSSLAEADSIMLAGRWKLTVDRLTGAKSLVDVIQDPLQTTDRLADQSALASRLLQRLEAWRRQQLAYYHFPAYYLNYFPPRPPSVHPSAN